MTEYALALSDAEVARYQFMAEAAERAERDLWIAAGAVPGARIADVGCGPGAVSVRLADFAESGGKVFAVDRDTEALAVARGLAERSGVPVETVVGTADSTGLPEGSLDLVMLRHVLAHNGGAEQRIVDHLATLVRPGGCVYLCDVDATQMRMRGSADPDLADLVERYERFHRKRGNDLSVGLRLDELLEAAGLAVVDFRGHIDIAEIPPGVRGPAWAARGMLVGDGLATEDDLARWNAAFERLERAGTTLKIFAVRYTAFGRLPYL